MTVNRFTDRATVGKVKRTSEGYLVTQARALRTGVQDYHASELGIIGNHTVRVFRPEESVRDTESLQSLAHAPITVGHPDEEVTADNWRELSVGEVSTAAEWDGEFISLPLILKDAAAIKSVEDGMAELSAGYIADMKAVDHDDYDFVMGPPKYNHLAIVDKARAGHQARIGDDAYKPWGAAPLDCKPKKDDNMSDFIKVMVGDKAVSVAADDAEVITKLVKDHEAELEAKDTKIAELKIECADTAKKVKTDEEISQMVQDGVKEIAAVSDKAAKLVDGYSAEGKDAMTIRKEVIAKVYGDEAIADLKTDAEIKAAFSVARVEEKSDPVRETLKDAKPKLDSAEERINAAVMKHMKTEKA